MENTLKSNLKRLRTDRGMTQAELAEKMNVKQVTISSWEAGRTEPSMGDIANLAIILECNQGELIGIKRATGDITFEDILVKIHSLTIDELKKLQYVIDNQININNEILKLEKLKAEQQAKLDECEKQLAKLRGATNET